MPGKRPASHSIARKITLVVLGMLLAGTVFLLPQFVSEPWIAGQDDLPSVPEASPSAVAPSKAAELTHFRQESQAVLAEVVVLRERLQHSQVERWAEAEFRQALERIEAGDEHYSYGEYAASFEQFQQARQSLEEIKQLGQQRLADAQTQASAAIESLNIAAAVAAADLATGIAPDDPEAQQLAARAAILAQVAVHIEAGDQALERDDFREAQAEFRAAVDLDPAHERASESLTRANQEITASTFRTHMSAGFAALENGDYDSARAAFRAAGKIFPGNAAVVQALAQADNRESGHVVNVGLERAGDLESREEWREAVSVYESLLERDPSLTDARVRLIPARVRADLDERLEGYIGDPLQLSSQASYTAAQEALRDARGISNPGPRLTGQADRLDALLQVANSPVDVLFLSDNQTQVVLFRVAELGRFDQLSVKLRPGKYVVAGTRNGFRDVRVEFIVTGNPMAEPIVVRCGEPVG